MKIFRRAALAAGLLPLLASPASAQQSTTLPGPADEREAVRAAVLDYVDALYDVDPGRVERSVHPALAKRGFWRADAASGYQELEMTYEQLRSLAARWNREGRVDPRTAVKEIVVLDVLDQTASAKLTADWGVDYLHLAKYDGRWQIVNVLWQSPPPPPEGELELGHLIQGTEPIEATFVLLDGATGTLRRYAPERAGRSFLPASTFKIPNSLIALETGVASGPDFTLPWDSLVAPTRNPGWARDQTLTTAFRGSVVWYYQELARRVGAERMGEWLARLDYGNRSIGGGLDRFWLDGELRISPEEQVDFLRRLYEGRLPVSAGSAAAVKEMMLLEDAGAYRLYGKTGTSEVTPTRENGWLVGFIEVDGGAHFYALNMEGETVWEDWPPPARAGLVTRILREAGVIGSGRGP